MSDLDFDKPQPRCLLGDEREVAVADRERAWRLSCAAGMAAIMAHDLAQPLTAINALLSVVLKAARAPVPDQGKLVDNLAKIEREARRASDIIRDIAQFAHRGASDIGPADLEVVFADILASLDDDVRSHGIAVSFDIPSGLSPVAVDPTVLGQIATCLMRNAIDAVARSTGAHRDISIAAAPVRDDMIEISVADTGAGIEPSLKPAIFDPFAPDRPQEWGVGLAVSRTIIEALGGRMDVTSNSSRGATVAFVLPSAGRKGKR